MSPGVRLLVARVGLGGQGRGSGNLSRILSDAGFEVIVSAPGLTPEMVADLCVGEAAEVVVLSMPPQSGTTLTPMVMKELRRHGAQVPVVISGVVLDADLPVLLRAGVAATFGPATPPRQICEIVHGVLAKSVLLAG